MAADGDADGASFATWCEDRRGSIVELLQALVRERSENPPGHETGVADIVRHALEQLGVKVTTFEPAPGRPTLVGTLTSGRPGRAVLCNAHMDTVPAGRGWRIDDPFSAVVRDGLVHGRGTVDHKSSIAALLVAAGCLKAHDRLDGRLVMVFDADEETGGELGMRHLLSSFDPDVEMAFYAMPTSYTEEGAEYFDLGIDNIAIGSPGMLEVQVVCSTETAYHVAPVDWYHPAEVAVQIAAAVTEQFGAPRWLGGHPRARLVRSTDGDQTWRVFVLPGEAPDSILADLRGTIGSVVGRRRGATWKLAEKSRVPAASCPADHPLVTALAAGALQATGRPATLGVIPTVTGMSIIQEALQVPVAGFGYGRIDLCHTPIEAISVDALVASAIAYSEALARLLANGDERSALESDPHADSWL